MEGNAYMDFYRKIAGRCRDYVDFRIHDHFDGLYYPEFGELMGHYADKGFEFGRTIPRGRRLHALSDIGFEMCDEWYSDSFCDLYGRPGRDGTVEGDVFWRIAQDIDSMPDERADSTIRSVRAAYGSDQRTRDFHSGLVEKMEFGLQHEPFGREAVHGMSDSVLHSEDPRDALKALAALCLTGYSEGAEDAWTTELQDDFCEDFAIYADFRLNGSAGDGGRIGFLHGISELTHGPYGYCKPAWTPTRYEAGEARG